MDKKTIIGLLLIFGIFIGFYFINAPSKEEIAARRKQQDSIQAAQATQLGKELEWEARQQAAIDDSLARIALLSNPLTKDSVQQVLLSEQQNKFGAFSAASVVAHNDIIVCSDVLTLRIASLGGRIAQASLNDYSTYGKEPVVLFTEEGSRFGFNLSVGNQIVPTSQLYFRPYINGKPYQQGDTLRISGSDSVVVSMRAYAHANPAEVQMADTSENYLAFVYTVRGNEYLVDYDLSFHHLKHILTDHNFLEMYWDATLRKQEKDKTQERNNSSIYYSLHDEVEYLKEGGRDDKEEISNIPIEWIGYKQQFFSSVLLAQNQAFIGANLETVTPASDQDICTMRSLISVPFDEDAEVSQFDMNFYFGPNKYALFSDMDKGLEEMIPLGWGFFLLQWVNRFAVIPVFDFLNQFNWSYGIIILILTLLVKMVLFPFTFKSYASSAKMKVLQPEIAKLSEKFPKKEQALQKQQAVMALYKRVGVNPMSGCLPMLLQFPILVAMFRFFPASIELRQQPFLWADDLSSYDSIYNLPFVIPFYGDHISLFCLLMTIAQLLYTRMTAKQQAQTSAMPGMKFMMYLMPIMMLFFLNNYSSALNYYYFLSLCITFLQTWIVRRSIDEGKILERLAATANKPVQKSKWQQRIENLEKNNRQLRDQRLNSQNARKKK